MEERCNVKLHIDRVCPASLKTNCMSKRSLALLSRRSGRIQKTFNAPEARINDWGIRKRHEELRKVMKRSYARRNPIYISPMPVRCEVHCTRRLRTTVLLVMLLAVGCASTSVRMINNAGRNQRYSVEKGIASWYGKDHAGRLTANGERFNPRRLTAAHKTLPFDTIVRVTNLKNNRQVVVRINDRGPYVERRIIDLSRRAAKKLDMLEDGVVPARVQVLKYSEPRKRRR